MSAALSVYGGAFCTTLSFKFFQAPDYLPLYVAGTDTVSPPPLSYWAMSVQPIALTAILKSQILHTRHGAQS
jgi:hypothetical protein